MARGVVALVVERYVGGAAVVGGRSVTTKARRVLSGRMEVGEEAEV